MCIRDRDKADDDAEGVFEVVQSDEREGADNRSEPSTHKHKVPERVHKAVSEALRCVPVLVKKLRHACDPSYVHILL